MGKHALELGSRAVGTPGFHVLGAEELSREEEPGRPDHGKTVLELARMREALDHPGLVVARLREQPLELRRQEVKHGRRATTGGISAGPERGSARSQRR